MAIRQVVKSVAGAVGLAVVRRETLDRLVHSSAEPRTVEGGRQVVVEAPPPAASVQSPVAPTPPTADDGAEYRLLLRSGEETVTVPKTTLDTLLRESLLLRRQSAELRTLKASAERPLAAPGAADGGVDPPASGPSERFYTPIFDFDGLRTDPRTIHNHDFMKDPRFVAAYARGLEAAGSEQHYYWRLHVALWCAEHALKLGGDFVECGVWRGLLSSSIMAYLDWNSLDRHFYLFDTFRGIDESQLNDEEILKGNVAHFRHHYQIDIYDDVVRNFAEYNNVTLCRGSVPDTLSSVEIGKVSYLSIDMNNAAPEIAAANYFWDRLVPGAVILLDDYGFVTYEEQKKAFDRWSAEHGVPILALPTGQGLMMKPFKS
ncbi:MAG: TylF/MycF/NovP-related O-methyltransferase [Roseiarcus sp.]